MMPCLALSMLSANKVGEGELRRIRDEKAKLEVIK